MIYQGNLGMAMLFEAVSARAGRLSSAATEARKTLDVKKSTLSEKNDQIHSKNYHFLKIKNTAARMHKKPTA